MQVYDEYLSDSILKEELVEQIKELASENNELKGICKEM